MNKDYHLYATFLAAALAGYSEADARKIAFAAQKVDDFDAERSSRCHTVTGMKGKAIRAFFDTYFWGGVGQMLDISDTWMTFHFIPRSVVAGSVITDISKGFACGYGEPIKHVCRSLISEKKQSLERIGITMHVLADSFAHQEFSGVVCYTPRIIRNINVEYLNHRKGLDILDNVPVAMSGGLSGIFYYGHGAAGHVPDLSWAKYSYTWKGQESKRDSFSFRDNPAEFAMAFEKMVEALSATRGGKDKESTPLFQVSEVRDYLKAQSVRIERERSNILDRNIAIAQAWKEVPWDIRAELGKGGILVEEWNVVLRQIREGSISVRYYDDDGKYKLKSEKIGTLLDEEEKSLPLDVESDTLMAKFYDQHLERGWLSAQELEKKYLDYLGDKQLDSTFEEEALKHKAAVYKALGIRAEDIPRFLEDSFRDAFRPGAWLSRLIRGCWE